jgi:hypothetical protein
VPNAMRAFVGRVSASASHGEPNLAAGLGLQVQRIELIKARDLLGVPRARGPLAVGDLI